MENEYNVEPINYQDCLPFILDIHYARRVPSISWAFGLFKKGDNPFEGKKNKLSTRQIKKKKRLVKYTKKNK